VWFSQNARGYTAILFLGIVATGLFRDLSFRTARPSLAAWGYAITMALATYTHMTAALIAVGHAIAAIVTTQWAAAESRQAFSRQCKALVLSGLITLCLYAPMLPQVVRQLSTPTMEGVAVEWTGAGWMLAGGARVLSQGVPGGLLTVGVAAGVLLVGLVSYWRQSRLTTLVMFLPLAVTFVAVVAARHNLWPRFFFFGAGFLVLAAVRGGFVLVGLVMPRHATRIAVAGAVGVAALSLVTVPRAWQPKQQFRAAFEFVEASRQPGDDVVALDVVHHVRMLREWEPAWLFSYTLPMLREVERSATRTWVVFTLPARLRANTPDLYEHVTSSSYRTIRVFPATVGGGEIHVLRNDVNNGQD
jgi:hypothetical protein